MKSKNRIKRLGHVIYTVREARNERILADAKAEARSYPKPWATRGGNSVDWYFYKTEGEALTCSEVAFWNADLMRTEGHEWFYHRPGQVEFQDEGDHAGLWRVTVP